MRTFLNSSAGKGVVALFGVAVVVVAVLAVRSFMGYGSIEDDASHKMYIDSATGKPFRHRNELGETLPIRAPSGGNTGMPAEACYWTKDGKAKTDPTWVLLNEEVGKTGPTFCPDCGRLVVGHNPQPGPGVNPPPTRAEYEQKHAGE